MDVYLTSYPLIRRDIGLLSKVPFRFAILDEAQYIKNAMSVGAGAVKQLKAQTRLALTGTPMENHPGELWSIFDFVLPGYLNSFAQFMHRFGTGEEADVLRSRIRPFQSSVERQFQITSRHSGDRSTVTFGGFPSGLQLPPA